MNFYLASHKWLLPKSYTCGGQFPIVAGNKIPQGKNLQRGEHTPLLAEMDDIKNAGSTGALISENQGKKFPQYLAAISANLGAFALGTCLSWTSPVSSSENSHIKDLMKNMTKEEEKEAWSWIGATMPIGGILSPIIIGALINFLGRKKTMLSLVLPFTIGWSLIIWPKTVWMVYIGRVLTGMAGGSFAVAAPLYTAEIAEKEIRGALGSYFQLLVVVGVLFVFIVGGYVTSMMLSIICGTIPLVFAVIFFFMPESPEFLLSKGEYSKAQKSLEFFRGKNYNVDNELKDIQMNLDKMNAERISLIKSFSTRAAKLSLFISLGLMFFQQLSGVNAVIFYAGDIFKTANENADHNTSSLIVGVVQVISTFISTLVVDRLGRKILLAVSSSAMCITTLLLGVFFYLKDNHKDTSSITWLPLVSLCIFIVAFSLGFGPIPWMILGELFPLSIKGSASSISSCFNWTLAFLVTKFYSPISDQYGTGVTFFIFMCISFCGVIFVTFFVKETKGKTPEEIQRELGNLS